MMDNQNKMYFHRVKEAIDFLGLGLQGEMGPDIDVDGIRRAAVITSQGREDALGRQVYNIVVDEKRLKKLIEEEEKGNGGTPERTEQE